MTMNKLVEHLDQYLDHDVLPELPQELIVQLRLYAASALAEVKGAKNQRNLAIHNTTRIIYERQCSLIEQLEDLYEEMQVPQRSILESLLEALQEGEEIE